jgi:hypothetical protein
VTEAWINRYPPEYNEDSEFDNKVGSVKEGLSKNLELGRFSGIAKDYEQY